MVVSTPKNGGLAPEDQAPYSWASGVSTPFETNAPNAPFVPNSAKGAMAKDKLGWITLAELARLAELDSTKLEYWIKLRLLRPVGRVGRTRLFDKEIAMRRIGRITHFQQRGYNLESIRDLLDTQ